MSGGERIPHILQYLEGDDNIFGSDVLILKGCPGRRDKSVGKGGRPAGGAGYHLKMLICRLVTVLWQRDYFSLRTPTFKLSSQNIQMRTHSKEKEKIMEEVILFLL